MAGIEDQGVSNRLSRIIDATADPRAVTDEPAFAAALTHGRERTIIVKAAFDKAVAAEDEDQGQNRALAARFDEALFDAADEYRVVKDELTRRLLPMRRKERSALDPAELEGRQAFLGATFDLPASDFGTLGRTAATNKLRSVVERVASVPAWAPRELVGPLAKAVEVLVGVHVAVVAEGLDDAALAAGLVSARSTAQAHLVAFRALLDGILRFEGSPLTVDAFLLRTPSRGTAAPAEPVPTDAPA